MAKGYKGGGTMKYKTVTVVKNKKDTYGDGQRAPMENPTMGRVLYSNPKGRTGRQEGSGPQS